MSQISRVTTFVDGQPPYSDDLNPEFNQIVSTVNALDDDNFSAAANISPTKIDSGIQGNAISRNSTTGVLSLAPDDSTIEISSSQLRIKDSGIVAAKLASNSVITAKILDANVTRAKITNNYNSASLAANQTITSSGADITGFSLSITTSGRPVLVAVYNSIVQISDPGTAVNGSAGTFGIIFYRDSTVVGRDNYGWNQSTVTTVALAQRQTILKLPYNFMLIDTPSSGTYTYKAAAVRSIGSSSVTSSILSGLKFLVMELI